MPVHDIGKSIMKATLKLVQKKHSWNKTWSWDYPMMTKTTSRLHLPVDAVDVVDALLIKSPL